jgi:tetratricopeptide (TPR) repeat protein
MTTLRFEPYIMPSAALGPDNPLPDLQKNMDVHAQIAVDAATITPEESRYVGWGRVNGILPYTLQDSYTRVKRPRAWRAAVLRNDALEAVFLPELGGRLWSLTDLVENKPLLHVNPVFQPCNLALRNAWISGGVEWNCGIIGHTPFTVAPLYTETLQLEDGTPVLRMYQYERVRGLAFCLEAMLPEASRQLIVHVRILNTAKTGTAVYWWSNMAVDETPDTRVIVPAERAYRFAYGKQLTKIPVPQCEGLDASYPMRIPQAMDFFFDIPEGQRRWIAAVNGAGYGLCQTSTDILQGRKLFVWGMGAGGRHWQTFLSEEGKQYLEIQAGLAHTQLEHLPMAGGAKIAWTEAYGPISAAPEAVQGADWAAARRVVEDALERRCPRAALETLDASFARDISARAGKRAQTGDAWGALEAYGRAAAGEAFLSGGLKFSLRAMGKAERPWKYLVDKGILPEADPLEDPAGYQVGDLWFERLKASVEKNAGDHWFAWYHLGVMYAYRNDAPNAERAFQRSLGHARSPWALRCLAVLRVQKDKLDDAADLMLEAVRMKPQRHLALEALKVLNQAGRHAELIDTANTLPAPLRSLGRCKVLMAEALLACGQAKEAERILRGKIELTDVREGEVRLTDLWFKLCELKGVSPEQNPPPTHLDFRMHQ